ncbi:MAG: hypothetical protein JWO41_807 [Candidatus Saccharibacteria bacterium]|nr:hypothetical protein [Candidatus Saccharibacteria bacterium]
MTFAIIIAALVLFYQASGGYGVDKNGAIIQNGFLYLSSVPGKAQIYLNGTLRSEKTNTRLYLPSNVYKVELRKPGYQSWQRNVVLDGASVERFDYPRLFPTKLTSTTLDTLTGKPAIASQSLDRRWLLVSQADSTHNFTLYDLKNPTKTSSTISLPAAVVTSPTTSESWQVAEWADDNRHVLLQHNYDDKLEYILLDRSSPAESLNLNNNLSASPTKLTLNNRKYDQYYLWNSDKTLQSTTLKDATPVAVADHVLAYQSYGTNTILYATDVGAPAGKTLIKLKVATQTYTVRTVTASELYVVNLTEYSGTLYVVCGSHADERVYVYKDPISQIQSRANHLPVPVQVLHVTQPNYVSFSDSTQYVMAENGSQIAVYDVLNKHGFNYTMAAPLDAPQAHANWMDGDRIDYVSGGKLVIFDYDKANSRTLVSSEPNYKPVFSPDYKYLYTLQNAEVAGNRTALVQTPILIPADL